jgi:hypothetical protein
MVLVETVRGVDSAMAQDGLLASSAVRSNESLVSKRGGRGAEFLDKPSNY